MTPKMKSSRKLRALVAGLIAVIAQITCGQSAQVPDTGNPPRPAYEVVSIRPSKTDVGARARFTSDGFMATSVPLQMVIVLAYGLDHDPNLTIGGDLIPGGPSWILSSQYDIQAKISESDIAVLQKLDNKQRIPQERLMLQSLLRDCFNLKMHFESKEVPGYSLVVLKSGPKNVKKVPEDTLGGFDRATGHLIFHASTMADFVQMLGQETKRPVLDKTALAGKYAFALTWSRDSDLISSGGAADDHGNASDPDSSGPSIFTAIQEQLGMKLVGIKTSVESPVIDQVDRPSPN
jgi:uncharacterized protein (TIGR03435 family)